jgi:hypothetical protein
MPRSPDLGFVRKRAKGEIAMKTEKCRVGGSPGSLWRRVGGPMRPAWELLLPYPGFCGFDGVCHVRVFVPCRRLPWRASVALVGGIDDNPGTSITNVIEVVAAVVRRQVFADGRAFVLIEHYADTLGDSSRPAFAIVRFKRTERQPSRDLWAHLGGLHVDLGGQQPLLVAPPGLLRSGFDRPRWYPVGHEELQARLGCEVRVWPAGEYTAEAIAGSEGKQLLELVHNRGRWPLMPGPLMPAVGSEVKEAR